MKSIFFFAAIVIAAQFTQAQNWTGAVNSDWNNPANWDGFPTTGDDITVSFLNYSGAMAHPVISSNSVFSPAGMLVDGGAVLTVSANITTTDRVEILGMGTELILNAGILSISGGAGNARFIFSEQSRFNMLGGELNVGQRLLFELGASGEITDGTIDIAETFALIDGFGAVSSTFHQAGGFIQTEEFGFENEAGNFHPLYVQTGGTLQVNGLFLAEGAAPGAGLGEFHATNGMFNVMGDVGNIAGSTMNYIFRIEEDAVFNFGGALIDQLPGDSIVITNGGKMNVNSALVWNNAGVITGQNGEISIGANVLLNGNGEYQFPHLTVLPGSTVTQSVPQIISVNGDFELSGTYSQLNHVLQFNGNAMQQFAFGQALVLDALVMNNSAESVVVSGNLTVSDSVKWLNGLLDLNGNELIFPNASVSLFASENSYAIGKVTKIGNQEFLFPVGSAQNRYRPVTIGAPTSVSSEITVAYHPQGYPISNPVEAPLQTVSSLEYWDITRVGSTDLVEIGVGWNDADASGLVDCASITLAHWDNAMWRFVPSVATGLCSGTDAGNLQSTAAIEDFGVFTIGFTEGVYQNVVSVCYGETYTVGTNVYDSTGIYIDQFVDVNGEDSTVVTSLTVQSPLNLAVTANITYLTSSADGASYQWLDCQNNFMAILGAQSQTFYPTENGTYAVIVTVNGCSDTSECVVIDQLALYETLEQNVVYPNPVQAREVLKLSGGTKWLSGYWIALDGTLNHIRFIDENSIRVPETSGFYVLYLVNENGTQAAVKVAVH